MVIVVGIITKLYHQKKLFKLGGCKEINYVDSFFIGTLKNGDPAEAIELEFAPEYTLPNPMYGFGCIHC